MVGWEYPINPREASGLDPEAVHRALAYYYEHPETMNRVERDRERVIEEHRERAVSGPGDPV
jgi:hypothetical protein